MSTPSARDLEARFRPLRPADQPHEVLLALREHSKRVFGNQDRLEVAAAIASVELGKVNATDLHQDVGLAVNRIRAQLLALVRLGLLEKAGRDDGKRVFKVMDRGDRFWRFATAEYEMVIRNPPELPVSGELAEMTPVRREPAGKAVAGAAH